MERTYPDCKSIMEESGETRLGNLIMFVDDGALEVT